MLRIKFISTLLMTCLTLVAHSQVSSADSLKVMFYNVLNFPDPNPAGKEDTLKTIMDYIQADLLMVCELKTATGASMILDDALNADGLNKWRKADFTTNTSSGANLQQLVFYNQNKLSLFSQDVIQTHVRDFNEYIFFLRDPFLAGHLDTTWLDVYVTHLKAGDSAPDRADRARMADSLRTYLDGRPPGRNIIFSGDFNLYNSSEQAWSTITEIGSDNVLIDPIDVSGSWNNSSSFADVHTQSTRTSSIFGDGAGGGMDSRFDFIMLSETIMFPSNRISYIEDSYTAFGNDGSCFNQRVLDCDAVPPRINSALYYMSDHIPVIVDLSISYPIFSGIEENPIPESVQNVWWASGSLYIESKKSISSSQVSIIGLDGKQYLQYDDLRLNSGINTLSLPLRIPNGMYLIEILDLTQLSNTNSQSLSLQTNFSRIYISN
ncbi:MAG: hypothetical protein ACI959_000688 [Limisphaerales bacterium]|jgi:hypothetical protein